MVDLEWTASLVASLFLIFLDAKKGSDPAMLTWQAQVTPEEQKESFSQ